MREKEKNKWQTLKQGGAVTTATNCLASLTALDYIMSACRFKVDAKTFTFLRCDSVVIPSTVSVPHEATSSYSAYDVTYQETMFDNFQLAYYQDRMGSKKHNI